LRTGDFPQNVQDLNRPEAAELAKLYALVAPNYAAVMEIYEKAQDVISRQDESLSKGARLRRWIGPKPNESWPWLRW
jgi:hypothetical protein